MVGDRANRLDRGLGGREPKSWTSSPAALLLEERWDQLGLIQITDAIVHLAGDLADRDALRGYDAVHLASALSAGDGAELLMVTWDDALGNAALRHGSSLVPASAPTS